MQYLLNEEEYQEFLNLKKEVKSLTGKLSTSELNYQILLERCNTLEKEKEHYRNEWGDTIEKWSESEKRIEAEAWDWFVKNGVSVDKKEEFIKIIEK